VTWIAGVGNGTEVRLESAASSGYAPLTCPMNAFRATLYILMFSLVLGPATAQQGPTFSSQSNLVLVPTLVRDEKGNVVYGLRAQDFMIEDDGLEQAVHLDEAAEAAPVSLVIAVQCGRRAWREFARMRGLASMLDPVLSDKNNQAALLFFDSKLNLAREFTNNGDLIEENLKNLQSGDGGAAILDAVLVKTACQTAGRTAACAAVD
jgi:VWFA-related protein